MSPHENIIFIPGPAGKLEAIVSIPETAQYQSIGIICHPHPLHHGTMHNKVVSTVARAFRDLNMPSIRFNYRGVGKSEGTFAEGIGETDDTMAVIQWAENKWQGCKIRLAGFSFGAYVSLRAATQHKKIEHLITVAPAVNRTNFSNLHPYCPWLVIVAGKDNIVPAADIEQWATTLSPTPELLYYPEATHFFDGTLVKLREDIIKNLAVYD